LTTEKKPKKVKPKSKGTDLKPYMIAVGVLSLILLLYISYRMYLTERNLIPVSIFALIAGAVFETKRLTEKWWIVISTALGSFFFSFLAFLPGKREHNYDFENHIQIWPYCFLIFFLIFTIAFNKDKVIPKLTEGITLLQSIVIIYWVVDFGLITTDNLFLIILMCLGLLFSIFSIFHAFTHTELTRTNRLTLSIWSTIIFVLLATENIIRIFQNEQIENTENITSGFYIGLQYFLLGISSVYIVQNYFMLIGFLPGKGTFFNKQYYKDLKELKSEHIKRYSMQQIDILHSLYCIIFTSGIFYLNFYYKIVPKHIAIWIVFVTFPLILYIYEYLTQKNYR
jgi:hypothetical protein